MTTDDKLNIGPGPAAYNPLMSYKIAVSRRQPTYMYRQEPSSSLPITPANEWRANTGYASSRHLRQQSGAFVPDLKQVLMQRNQQIQL